MIKFDTSQSLDLGNFLSKYQTWIQSQQFFSNRQAIACDESGPDSIPCYFYSDIERIKSSPSDVVAIDALHEGLHNNQLMNSYPKDKHYIIFSGAHPQDGYRLDLNYQMICYSKMIYETTNASLSYLQPYFYQDHTYHFDYPKQFLFATVNGTARGHRVELAEKLPQAIAPNKFVFRLAGKDYGANGNEYDVVKLNNSLTDMAQVFVKKAQHVDQAHHYYWKHVPTKLFNQACFNLVIETEYDLPIVFVTDKSLRPFMLGMPFVTMGSVGHLRHLKNLGFETYESLWDESYDLETDHAKRLTMVVKLCQDLQGFNWQANREQIKAIGNHNRSMLVDQHRLIGNEFEEFERIIKTYER